jgi:hypothetical protein
MVEFSLPGLEGCAAIDAGVHDGGPHGRKDRALGLVSCMGRVDKVNKTKKTKNRKKKKMKIG